MRSKWLTRGPLRALVLGVLGSSVGCAEERDPINRVQAGVVPKAFFLGDKPRGLQGRPGVPDASPSTSTAPRTPTTYAGTIGGASAVERIRWEVTENYLLARRSYQEAPARTTAVCRARKSRRASGVPHRADRQRSSRPTRSRATSTFAAATTPPPAKSRTRSKRTRPIARGSSASTCAWTGRRTRPRAPAVIRAGSSARARAPTRSSTTRATSRTARTARTSR